MQARPKSKAVPSPCRAEDQIAWPSTALAMSVFRCEACGKDWKDIQGKGGWILDGSPRRRLICPDHPGPDDREILAEAALGETTQGFVEAFLKGERREPWSRAPWDGGASRASQGLAEERVGDEFTELLREWEGQSQTSTFGVTRWLSGLRRWRCA